MRSEREVAVELRKSEGDVVNVVVWAIGVWNVDSFCGQVN